MDDETFSTRQPLTHKVGSLLPPCRYFHGKCSYELHSLGQSAQIFTAKTCLVTSIGLNHPHSLRIPIVRMLFHFESFLEWTLAWVISLHIATSTSPRLGQSLSSLHIITIVTSHFYHAPSDTHHIQRPSILSRTLNL